MTNNNEAGLLSPDELEAIQQRREKRKQCFAEWLTHWKLTEDQEDLCGADVDSLRHHISALSRQPAPVVTAMLERVRETVDEYERQAEGWSKRVRAEANPILREAATDDRDYAFQRRDAARVILTELERIAQSAVVSPAVDVRATAMHAVKNLHYVPDLDFPECCESHMVDIIAAEFSDAPPVAPTAQADETAETVAILVRAVKENLQWWDHMSGESMWAEGKYAEVFTARAEVCRTALAVAAEFQSGAGVAQPEDRIGDYIHRIVERSERDKDDSG